MAPEGYHGQTFAPCATVQRSSLASIRFACCLTPFEWPRKRSSRWSAMSDVNSKEVGNSEAGMKTYARKALGHARIVAAALHDPQLCPIEQTRMLFNDHSGVAVTAAADARAC